MKNNFLLPQATLEIENSDFFLTLIDSSSMSLSIKYKRSRSYSAFQKKGYFKIENFQLISFFYKLLTKVIIKRLIHEFNAYQPIEWARYRKIFSTIYHLQTENPHWKNNRTQWALAFVIHRFSENILHYWNTDTFDRN